MAVYYWHTSIAQEGASIWELCVDQELHQQLGIDEAAQTWVTRKGSQDLSGDYGEEEAERLAIAAARELARQYPQYADRIRAQFIDHFEINPEVLRTAVLEDGFKVKRFAAY